MDQVHETQSQDEQVESLMANAFRYQEAGHLNEARHHYRAADGLLRQEGGPRRALVLVTLGELERSQGNLEEARHLLDEALASAPGHIAALRGRAAIAQQAGESAIAAAMLHRLVEKVDAPEDRSLLYTTIVSESLSAARQAVEGALGLRPADPELLERHREVCAALGDFAAAVTSAVALAEQVPEPKRRAAALVEAARLCSEKAANTPRAVALYEAAIEDDPEVVGAFEAIEAELVRSRDYSALAAAYERQIARLAQSGAIEAQRVLLDKLATVYHSPLEDLAMATRSAERLVEIHPGSEAARLRLAAFLEEGGDLPNAIRALEGAAVVAPHSAVVYQRLGSLVGREKDKDREFAACAALVALGEADINEQLFYSQYAPEGLPVRAFEFDEDTFAQLAPPWHPEPLDSVFASIEGAAMRLWHEDNALLLRSMLPNQKSRVDPKKTTVSAVRAFAWASHVLRVPQPTLYVEPDNARVSVATLPSDEPAMLLGRPVLSGRSVVELAFIAVHHLCYARPGWRLLAFWTDAARLQALLHAALGMFRRDSQEPASEYIVELRHRLTTQLVPASQAALEEATTQVSEQRCSLDVVTWARSVEQIACRAALLASGDVSVSRSILSVAGTPMGGESAAERASVLLPFSVSQRHSALRHLLGTALS